MTAPASRRALGAVLALVLLLAGCTSGSDGTDTVDVITVHAADTPGIPWALLRFAIDRGFFIDQGLDVRVAPDHGGAATIPGLVAGEVEIVGTDLGSALLARSQGVPLQIISAGTFASEEPQFDFAQVVVAADSPVHDPGDLDGHRVAVNHRPSIAELTIRGTLDTTGVEFVEMDHPDMLPALAAGEVHAVHLTEPLLALALRDGLRPIMSPYAQTRPGMAVGAYVASQEFVEQHPNTVDRFVAGVSAASQHVADNPNEFRRMLVELSGVDPAVGATVSVPRWGGPVDVPSVELVGELMVGLGWLDTAPPVEEIVYRP
jgi:ABC-type nitrate/sulfonate/bicarbonate transport system substrate-binding protein